MTVDVLDITKITRPSIVVPTRNFRARPDTPFFYEDSRHVFYVTTMEQQGRPSDHPGYGVVVTSGFKQVGKIVPLILQADPGIQVGPKFWGHGEPVGPNMSVIDPIPMKRFVSEDAYIHKGIGTTGSVMYGESQIGPAGAIRDVRSMK